MGEGLAMPTDPQHTPTILHPSTSQSQKTQTPRELTMDTEIPQSSGPTEHVADEVVHKERGDSLVRAATTASSLEAEQDSGGGPRCQETMGYTIAQTRFENVSTQSYDPLLARDDDITLVSVHDVNVSAGEEEVFEVINTAKLIIDAAQVSVAGDKVSTAGATTTVSVATTTIATTVEEITLAQALADLKIKKPKSKGITFREPGESITTTTIPSKIQNKGKFNKSVRLMMDKLIGMEFELMMVTQS
ncbi:hypothetical protein Tco_1228369 [Tanacetum coccineum]